MLISIHALLAESDNLQPGYLSLIHYFYPRSPCGERHDAKRQTYLQGEFLSTLSLRRATPLRVVLVRRFHDFYPRSPCGERLIHPLLCNAKPNFYPRSPCGERPKPLRKYHTADRISIHALLAESDTAFYADCLKRTYFYPRSPCGERPLYSSSSSTPAVHFYPRSPCGERPVMDNIIFMPRQFLSTLSLRRATKSHKLTGQKLVFLSTLSLRRATLTRTAYF